MKVKLDENLGTAGRAFLRSAGIDVATVVDQGLCSAADERLLQACTAEGRCLITLDKDFSDPLRYPPSQYAGVVVVRLPSPFRLPLLERALGMVVEASKQGDVNGRLWVAEVDRIREHQERVE